MNYSSKMIPPTLARYCVDEWIAFAANFPSSHKVFGSLNLTTEAHSLLMLIIRIV